MEMLACRSQEIGILGADHLIPGGGLWFFCEKKDCSADFGI